MKHLNFLLTIFFCTSFFTISAQYPENTYRLSADSAYNKGNYEVATMLYTQAIEFEPNADNLILRANTYLKLNLQQAALNDFLEAEKKNKAMAAFEIAALYAQIGDVKNATLYLDLHLKSKYRKSQNIIDETFDIYSFYGQSIDASKYYSKVEKKLTEVDFEIEYGNDNDALLLLDDIIYQYNKNEQAYYKRALLQTKKSPKWALKDAMKAVQIAKRTENYVLCAKLYNQTKKYKKALENIENAIQKNPYIIDLYLIRAEANAGLQKYENATADIDFALRYLPDDKNTLFSAASIYYKNADYMKALKIYNNLVSKDNSKAEYYIARGKVHLAANNYAQADADFSMALDLAPFNGEAYCKKGITSYKLGKSENAYSYWAKALKYNNKEASEYLLKHFPGR